MAALLSSITVIFLVVHHFELQPTELEKKKILQQQLVDFICQLLFAHINVGFVYGTE